MSVYRIYPSEGHEWVVADSTLPTLLRTIVGTPVGANWPEPKVQILQELDGVPRLRANFPWLVGSVLVCDEAAKSVVDTLLRPSDEWLRLDCDDRELWLANVLADLDAVDFANSRVTRNATGRVMGIQKYALRRDALPSDITLFRIAGWARGPLHCTNRLVDAAESTGLTGLTFRPVAV